MIEDAELRMAGLNTSLASTNVAVMLPLLMHSFFINLFGLQELLFLDRIQTNDLF